MKVRRLYLAGGAGVVVAVAAAAVGLFLGLGGGAGGAANAYDPFVNQYTAKFLCGTIAPDAAGMPDPFTQPLAPGVYHTDINVHNASNPNINVIPPQPAVVYIQKKVVATPLDILLPAPQQSVFEIIGSPTLRERLTLNADEAFQIDCAAISDLLAKLSPAGTTNPCLAAAGTTGFCKGEVVIEGATQISTNPNFPLTPAQLDVTDIITVTQLPSAVAQSQPVSLDFEYVTPKRVFYPCWSNTAPTPCPP